MDNLDQVTINNIQDAVCKFVQRYGENEEILRAKAIIYFFKSVEKLVKELGKGREVTEPFSYSEIETEIYKMAQVITYSKQYWKDLIKIWEGLEKILRVLPGERFDTGRPGSPFARFLN